MTEKEKTISKTEETKTTQKTEEAKQGMIFSIIGLALNLSLSFISWICYLIFNNEIIANSVMLTITLACWIFGLILGIRGLIISCKTLKIFKDKKAAAGKIIGIISICISGITGLIGLFYAYEFIIINILGI
jgi:hypothetical protein